MNEQMEVHLANLLSIGYTGQALAEKGYAYGLALLAEEEIAGAKVTAAHMGRVVELVRDALPGAHSIFERRFHLTVQETGQT